MDKLSQLRKDKGWSQSKLSDISGVSQAYISDLEAGKKNPTIKILEKISRALDVPISKLLDEKNS